MLPKLQQLKALLYKNIQDPSSPLKPLTSSTPLMTHQSHEATITHPIALKMSLEEETVKNFQSMKENEIVLSNVDLNAPSSDAKSIPLEEPIVLRPQRRANRD
jgi:hypothetical protein